MIRIKKKYTLLKTAPLMVSLLLMACNGEDSGLIPETPNVQCSATDYDCDSDKDGQSNGEETDNGSNPFDPNDPVLNGDKDDDKDGLSNGWEEKHKSDPNDPNSPVQGGDKDQDGDGIKNGQETVEGWDDNDANNPVSGGSEDQDGDGIKNGQETVNGWDDNDLNNPVDHGDLDSDGDGIKDGREEVEDWNKFDPNDPVENGDEDKDNDGFKNGLETVNSWDDNDPNNPISAEKVQNPTLALDNTTVTLGMGVQARIDFTVQGETETYNTLDVPDSSHVTWQVLDADGGSVADLTPTSEGYVVIPDLETSLAFADGPLTMQASFVEGGWFDGQADQEANFNVTLAAVSSSEVTLLKDGEALTDNAINVSDAIAGQTTVQLADGSSIVVPADASLGTWSVDQAATDLGVTIDPVTGAIDTSKADLEVLGVDGVAITVTWMGTGPLLGGEDSIKVSLKRGNLVKVTDDLWVGPVITYEQLIKTGINALQTEGEIAGYVYHEDASAYCNAHGLRLLTYEEATALAQGWNSGTIDRLDYYANGYYNSSGTSFNPKGRTYLWYNDNASNRYLYTKSELEQQTYRDWLVEKQELGVYQMPFLCAYAH